MTNDEEEALPASFVMRHSSFVISAFRQNLWVN